MERNGFGMKCASLIYFVVSGELMTIAEVIPIIKTLSHADKLRLMKIILAQLSNEEEIPLQASMVQQQDPLLDIIGIAEGEETDVARRHDEYLYSAS